MSDGARQPQQPPRGTPSSTSMPRVSQTNPRVMSAARAAPLPKEQLSQEALRQKLKSESANVALNALSIVKEKVEEFRQQDRFFKYKAFIVGGWLLLSVTTFGVTCGRGAKETGDFGAKLVVVPARSSVSIMNKSEEPWTDVTIVVKDNKGAEWRASVARVAPTKEVTITPKQLLGSSGQAAPMDITIRGVEMRTSEGRAVLLEDGQNLTEDAQ
jgi:hypothetical protein